MDTEIPPLSEAEKLEFGNHASSHSSNRPADPERSKLVVASYNIRYARGPYLIPGGIVRKLGLMSLARRPQHIGNMISLAARAFTTGKLLPATDTPAREDRDAQGQSLANDSTARHPCRLHRADRSALQSPATIDALLV